MVTSDPGIWVGAILILMMYSYLYKENPLYRIAENILIGVGTAQIFLVGWESIIKIGLTPMLSGNIIIPALSFIVGAMLFGQLTKEYRWTARTPIALLVGVGTGLAVRGMIEAQFTKQLIAMISVVSPEPIITMFNLYMMVITVAIVFYFVFSIRTEGALGTASEYLFKLGRLSLMAAFGVMVGNIAMGRWTLVIGRIMYLLYDWIGIPG